VSQVPVNRAHVF